MPSFKFEAGEPAAECPEFSYLKLPTSNFRRTAGGTSCTNKPNSHRSHVRGKSFMGKELWCIAHAPDFGKTKPIRGMPRGTERRGRGTWSAVRTKPIWPKWPTSRVSESEKCKTKSIPEGVSSVKFQALGRPRAWSGLPTLYFTLQTRRQAVRAKQTQFVGAPGNGRGLAALSLGHIAPNKPNSPTWTETVCSYEHTTNGLTLLSPRPWGKANAKSFGGFVPDVIASVAKQSTTQRIEIASSQSSSQ